MWQAPIPEPADQDGLIQSLVALIATLSVGLLAVLRLLLGRRGRSPSTAGATGATGATGASGAPGAPGTTGATGARGLPGVGDAALTTRVDALQAWQGTRVAKIDGETAERHELEASLTALLAQLKQHMLDEERYRLEYVNDRVLDRKLLKLALRNVPGVDTALLDGS